MSRARSEERDVAALVASVGWGGGQNQGAGLIVVALEPPRVIWASPYVMTLFNTTRLDKLSRLVLGNPTVSRSMGARLGRLKASTPPHLERILLASGFRVAPLTLLCKAVDPALASAVVVIQIVGTSAPQGVPAVDAVPVLDAVVDRTPAANGLGTPDLPVDDGERFDPVALTEGPDLCPNRVSPDTAEAAVEQSEDGLGAVPQPPEPIEVPRLAPENLAAHYRDSFKGATTQRFVWQADASGRLSEIGPAFAACVGTAALQPGTNLVEGIAALSSEAAEVIGRAIEERRSWAGVVVPWPVENADALVSISFGGAPRVNGFRGFGIVALGQITPAPMPEEPPASAAASTVVAAAPGRDTNDAIDSAADQVVDVPVAEASGSLPETRELPIADEHEAIPPVGTAVADPDPAESPRIGETATPWQAEVERWGRPGRTGGLRQDGEPGSSKVVHLSSFKAAPPSVQPTSPRPAPTELDTTVEVSDLDAPRWAETPGPERQTNRDEVEVQLSSNERYNFDEIARTLGAGPPPSVGKPATDSRAASPVADRATGENSTDVSSLLDYLPIGTIVTQFGRLLYANRTILNLLGYESLEAMRSAGGLNRLFKGHTTARMLETIATQPVTIASRDGDAVAADVRLQTITWQGEPATLLSVRRSLEREAGAQMDAVRLDLANSRSAVADLTEALDLAVSGMGFLDLEGRILAINAGAERLFGFDQREIVGDACAVLLGSDQAADWATFFAGFVSEKTTGRTTAFRRFAGRKRNGVTLRLAASLRRVGPDRVCIIWTDDSHRQGADDELDRARHEAERASSLKSEFLAKVSHEIRTPLNAILGFAEIIMDERFGPIGTERYKEYLKDIHASGTHVMSLVNDLLDLSRIEAGGLDLNLVRVDPNAIVSECVATLQGQAHRERIIIRSSLASRLPAVLADERALRQIVLNLLSNAVKFNEPGGQVIVSTTLTENGAVAIRVRDTGLGMSDEDIATAMKPFRQLATPKATAGSGLGLPLTKALVDANHASMTIRSRPREGTLVEVVLQCAPSESLSLPAE